MRRWHEYIPWGVLALTFLLFGFLLWNDTRSQRDREELHRALEAQREMLDARAEIQVILIRRAVENRPLRAEEVGRMGELCRRAEYDRIPGGCAGAVR